MLNRCLAAAAAGAFAAPILAQTAPPQTPAQTHAHARAGQRTIADRVHYCQPGADGQLEGGFLIMDIPLDENIPAARGGANVTTILDNGPASNRIDLTFVGDGYTANQLGLYAAHVESQYADFFAFEPFATYQSYFNVHRVDVISNESGVDNDPVQGISRDTALDMGFWCSGIERLLCVSVNKARAQAAAAPGRDQVIAVANSTKYGGAGYTLNNLATTSGGNGAASQVYIHELGHSLGNLADEYTYGGPTTYAGPEFPDANASIFNAQDQTALQLKWHRWMGESFPGFDSPVSTYEGCHYSVFGAYRPSNNSMMRNLGRPFNMPSVEALIIEFYKIVSPIDDASPNDVVYEGHDTVLTVTPMRPLDHELDIQWSLNAQPIPGQTGQTLRVCELQLQPGTHIISAEVIDNTPWVRDESARQAYHRDSISYAVSIATPPGDRTGDGELDFSDVLDFLADFGAADPSADLAAPEGVFDFSDVLEFLARFATPCG